MLRLGGKYTPWFHLCRVFFTPFFFPTGSKQNVKKRAGAAPDRPWYRCAWRVMERTLLEITQLLDADGGRAGIRAPRLLSGRIRKSLTCFKWETGQNVALHHMFTLARQENHFFSFFFFLNGLRVLGFFFCVTILVFATERSVPVFASELPQHWRCSAVQTSPSL